MTPWIRWNADPAPAELAWRWLAEDLGMPALLATPPRHPADMRLGPSRLNDAFRQKVDALLGRERVHLDDDARIRHAAGHSAIGELRVRQGDVSHAPDAVVCTRREEDVLALLRLCDEAGIAVNGAAGAHTAALACDMTGMTDILSLDAMSGLAQVEAGISSAELARQLAARNLAFGPANFSTLGGWIARGIGIDGVEDVRLATPQGLLPSGGLQYCPGIVTAATLRVHAAPVHTLQQSYLFPDFASGLAALRETQRESGARTQMRLSDAGETRFQQRLASLRPSLWRQVEEIFWKARRPGDSGAALEIGFGGPDVEISRKHFAALAKKLGARPCDPQPLSSDYPALLLDRGVMVDRVHAAASWSNLPVLYAALRTALDQAMRSHAPRDGAHGLVLGRITGVRHDGADLTCTFIFPRRLNGDVAQALAVRQAALDVLTAHARTENALEAGVRRAVKGVLDPKDILPPA